LIEGKGFGLTHIYYGQGVGKTTRAVGMAIRAAGTGLKVDFVQFMKSGKSGEVAILEKIPNIFELLRKNRLLELIERCKRKVELVMTGMSAPIEFIEFADYATEFIQIKHAYYIGAKARKGIEY
jgi:cob(I)alamin adenosyltransferase